MTQSKIITIDDTPDSVAGRLPGFCATNAEGIGITVEEEPAPRGLIYFRVHCGDKKAASALFELRAEQGRCVIGWGWRHGLTRLGKPGNREEVRRCRDFCAGFLAYLVANNPPKPIVTTEHDSGHFNFSRSKRRDLVEKYRREKSAPQITPSEPAGKAVSSGRPKAPEKGADVETGLDYVQAMADAVVAPVVPSSEAEERLIRRGTKVTVARLKREEQNMIIAAMMETHALEIIADKVGLVLDTVKTRIKKLKNSP